jgi:hypothetical protein
MDGIMILGSLIVVLLAIHAARLIMRIIDNYKRYGRG